MLSLFKDVKAVGFDLDRTLYPNSSLIDEKIQTGIALAVIKGHPELGSIKEVCRVYVDLYRQIGSASRVLERLGVKDPRGLLGSVLAETDISQFLKKDNRLVELLVRLKNKYRLFLITTNPSRLARKVLGKLGLTESLFDDRVYGDNPEVNSKVDGAMFNYFLKISPFKPNEHLYVGDSLRADILPARKLGMLTIALGNIPEADRSVSSIYEIESLLL